VKSPKSIFSLNSGIGPLLETKWCVRFYYFFHNGRWTKMIKNRFNWFRRGGQWRDFVKSVMKLWATYKHRIS